MTDQELLDLKVDELSEEEARAVSIQLLQEDLAGDRSALRIGGVICLVLTAAMLLVGMDTIPGYAIMGLDSVFLFSFFDKLQVIHKKKKQLKSFEEGVPPEKYSAFLRSCQEFVRDRQKYLKEHRKDRGNPDDY